MTEKQVELLVDVVKDLKRTVEENYKEHGKQITDLTKLFYDKSDTLRKEFHDELTSIHADIERRAKIVDTRITKLETAISTLKVIGSIAIAVITLLGGIIKEFVISLFK